MSQSQKAKTNPIKKTFLECLQECLEAEDAVEVLTDSREITGLLSIIGTDFIGLTHAVDRTITTSAKGQDGTIEKKELTTSYELETFIKFKDLQAVSRVLKSRKK